MQAKSFGEHYAEFVFTGIRLTLWSQAKQEGLAPGSTSGGQNASMLLEIKVKGVEDEFTRIKEMDAKIAKEPTTRPWGNRSFHFRDPVGNIVNFYEDLDT